MNVLRPSAEGGTNTHYRALIDRQQLQLQHEQLSDEARIQALEGYVTKYATEPAIGDELSSFLALYPYQRLRRARFLESILQRAVALGAKERKELQAEVKRCLRSELAADVDRTFLDRVTVRLGASYLVKQVTARLYKVPTLIRPDQRKEWTPGRTAQPIETKILTLVADSLGEGKDVAPFTMRITSCVPTMCTLSTQQVVSPRTSGCTHGQGLPWRASPSRATKLPRTPSPLTPRARCEVMP